MARKPNELSAAVETPPNIQPKIISRGEIRFRHDLFKLAVEKAKKNVSWKKADPMLVDVEHTHFFHSHNMRGQKNKYSIEISGHFHEVVTKVDKDGNFVSTCGPALHKKTKTLKTGKPVVSIEPVQFEDGNTGRIIFDNHTHEIEYLGSEEISSDSIRRQQEADANKLKQYQAASPQTHTQTATQTPAADPLDSDTVTLG